MKLNRRTRNDVAHDASRPKRPAHRPRKDPSCLRVVMSMRLHPITVKKLAVEAKRVGISRGEVIDLVVKCML